jgi:hypothetical protein
MNIDDMMELPWVDALKIMVKNAEERYVWYKKELETVFKDKVNFPADDPFSIWLKNHLRETKNDEERNLKHLTEQYKHEREGLNPPSFYK